MSTTPELQVETSEAICTADTTITTTTTSTTTGSANIDTTSTTTTTAISYMKEEKSDTAESSNLMLEKSENEQLHRDSVTNSATISITENLSSVVVEEKADLMQPSNCDTVAEDKVIADDASNDASKVDVEIENNTADVTASEVTCLQSSANSFNQNRLDCNMSDSANLEIVSDQISRATESVLPESEINATTAVVEETDTAFIPSNDGKNEIDLKDDKIRKTDDHDTAKENSGSEGDSKTREEYMSLDDKEASSDEGDHFVDAKSSTQIDGNSGDGLPEGDETKEQTEEIQDEEVYEYDEEVGL